MFDNGRDALIDYWIAIVIFGIIDKVLKLEVPIWFKFCLVMFGVVNTIGYWIYCLIKKDEILNYY